MKKGLLLLFVIISGCYSYDKEDLYFNSSDLSPVSSFKQGDTIYYESSSGDLDTILIEKIDSICSGLDWGFMSVPPENQLFVLIKNLPNDRRWSGMRINASTGFTPIDYQEIINLRKDPNNDKRYFICFRDFYTVGNEKTIGKLRSDTVTVNGTEITNFYEIKHGYPERLTDSSNIEILYWTDQDGLMAYKNKQGEWWLKKSTSNTRPR